MKCWHLENPPTGGPVVPATFDCPLWGGECRGASRAVSAAGAWKMTRKVTWCAGSAIGFKSDVQPPFVKLYLYFYPGLAQISLASTGGVSSGFIY